MSVVVVDPAALDRFVRAALDAAGADAATTDAVARALMHASRIGVDSHGVRLLEHYISVMEGGRVNKAPNLTFVAELGAIATLDADNAHGARATYAAMDKAVAMAETSGIGAVSIRNSSHFGAAGAFAIAAAEKGMIGFATCNSDAFVRLHDGAFRFHGTNPLAFAAPADDRPWLFDMATSAIPFNRVQLYRSLGVEVPEGTGSDAAGIDTRDANLVEMLAPLGAAFGFKGAGLAGVAEIFSAVLSGMGLSFELAPMGGPDKATPRGLGAFVLALRPDAFVAREVFADGMRRYLTALRGSAPREGGKVMAPGDREWAVAAERADGIPLDPVTVEGFGRLAERYGLPSLDGL
ncbi:Ldh family oxidoreductase [Acuticoccus yangtzensis]|uniref:Ldh family oxidoreductase n=1 Tax=Acuticoccus yangtzensis TaxID=1443441 RepID=UPI0009498DC1|nr:Ldh family oxidoreductase [Acuticoccus yangtzensis]